MTQKVYPQISIRRSLPVIQELVNTDGNATLGVKRGSQLLLAISVSYPCFPRNKPIAIPLPVSWEVYPEQADGLHYFGARSTANRNLNQVSQ